MHWLKLGLISMVVLVHTPLARALPRPCATHETCTPPDVCTCTTPARSAGWVYYYYDIPVERDHVYSCSMSGFDLWVLKDLATYPEGVTATWESCCQFAPAVVHVDTHGMTPKSGKAIIKYGRAPSDGADVGTVQCAVDPE